MSQVNKDDLEMLVQLGHKLTLGKFTTSCVLDSLEIVDLLHAFLVTQTSTLRTLKILQTSPPTDPLDPFLKLPPMKQLQKFRLYYEANQNQADLKEIPSFKLIFDKITMSETWPQLKKFCFKNSNGFGGIDMENPERVTPSGVTALGLKTRKLNRCACGLEVILLSYLYGSVTDLKLFVTTEMPLILENCISLFWFYPHLRSLKIVNSQDHPLDLDEFLSGISPYNQKAVAYELSKAKPQTKMTLRLLGKQFKVRAGLGALEHLQKLVFTPCNKGYIISDIGGYLGLALASSQLQHVAINCKPRQSLISPECQEFIRNALGPTVVIDIV
jgi:hypothetical protein